MPEADHYLKRELYDLVQNDPAIFEFIQAGSLDGVWYWDLESVENEWMSPRFWEALGHDPSMKKHLASEWQDMIHPDDLKLALRNLDQHSKDPLHPYDQLVRYRHKNGSTVWVRCRGLAIRDESGKPIRLLGAHTDVTQLKEAESEIRRLNARLEERVGEQTKELKETQQQLLQAQKLEAIGRLAGGVAHDFNNLLVVILGYADLVLSEMPGEDPLRKKIVKIRAAGHRARNLTQQLLAFSRKQVRQPRPMQLNDTIRRLAPVLNRLVRENIEQVLMLRDDAGAIDADPSQIDQILINLVANARDAMPSGGKLTLETSQVNLDDAYAATHEFVSAGPHVLLSVTDTGLGMDEDTVAHVFEPFFTTKEGSGTGLGLATVYGIVKQSGGHIWVYSEPGKGTTFKVYFPCHAGEAQEVGKPALSEAAARGGTETILLVEDDAEVRGFVSLALEQQGYKILEAESPRAAFRILERHAGAVDLLLTDVVLPEMSGRDLFDSLSKSRPETKVLYVSGYTDNAIVHHGVLDPDTPFLTKPFATSDLLAKVRAALDG